MTPATIAVFTPKSEPHDTARAVHLLRDELAGLVNDCDASLARNADIHDLVGRLIKAVAAGSEIAVDRAQTPLRTKMTMLEQDVARLQGDLDAERRHLAEVRGQLDTEKTDRMRAEAALQESRSITQQIVARYDTQVHALKSALDAARAELGAVRQQLEMEQAERRRVATALDTVQQALNTIRPGMTSQAAAAPTRPASPAVKAPAAATPAPAPPDQLIPEPPREQVELLQRLLDEAGDLYRADIEAGIMPIDIVDRLTANLRHVRQTMERQFPEPAGATTAVFQRELTALLDATGETAFGRHLSIAAAACAVSEAAAPRT